MKIVIFGLSISSSWGNGHATLWRGLCRALGDRGHSVVFFERDVPYYAGARDGVEYPGCDLRIYHDWPAAIGPAREELAEADVGMVTSYCPDGIAACDLVLESGASVRAFYDLDTPVTLSRLREGNRVEYLPANGLAGFDVVLSYTGGAALTLLVDELGAQAVAPLYGSVDPAVHAPAPPEPDFASHLSYLGTYAEDRQQALEELFIGPARNRPGLRFVIGGAQYPHDFPWTQNIFFVRHIPPGMHSSFYCSSRLTLNVTRQAMAKLGFCPQGRLFEAAACGTPIVSDAWEGLEEFYTPDSEILLCRSSSDVVDALSLTDAELGRMARSARERTLTFHTADRRAAELESIFERTYSTGSEAICGV